MDNLEEVKKLKKLLDEGVIDEEDFSRKKSELLGISKKKNYEVIEDEKVKIKKETKTKNKSLDDYKKELLEESHKVEKNIEKSNSNDIDDYYQKEKAKIRAKLDAEEEVRKNKKAEQKVVVGKGISKAKRISKWILAIICWVCGFASVCLTGEWFMYLPEGIIFLVLGCMACPIITDYTINNQKLILYTKTKIIVVWILIILWLILVCVFPVHTN